MLISWKTSGFLHLKQGSIEAAPHVLRSPHAGCFTLLEVHYQIICRPEHEAQTSSEFAPTTLPRIPAKLGHVTEQLPMLCSDFSPHVATFFLW